MRPLALTALPVLLLVGCPSPRSACDPNAPSTVELRDGNGALIVAAKRGPGSTLDVCGPSLQRLGGIKESGGALTLLDAGGAPRLILKKDGSGDAEGTGPDGQTRLRVHREDKQLFVLDAMGIRLAMIATGDKTVFYDKQQTPAGTIEPRGSDQVVRDPDGATQLILVPGASSSVAGVFTAAGLDRPQELALYLLLSR